jgi:uncharacterized alpha-E superfamily protein
MLSRTAASLYWLGRYVERAEFTVRLVEATLRLDALSTRPAGDAAWLSALTVLGADEAFMAKGQAITQQNVTRYLTIDASHAASVRACLDFARNNARAVRTALTREAWSAINRAWLLFNTRASPRSVEGTLALVEQAEIETRGFEGAITRMLRNPASAFMRLGAAVERADNTARLLEVKYHILLPEDEAVGGTVDRDQWTTLLRTVSAVNAYRWLYRDGLKPFQVIEMLVLRHELPRSLIACAEEVVALLEQLKRTTGNQGDATSRARARYARLADANIPDIVGAGLHEYLEDFITENMEIDEAIARKFRFV